MEYNELIIIPYIIQKRKELNPAEDHPALAICDAFRGQQTASVLKMLEDNNISNCTDRLQPLDLC